MSCGVAMQTQFHVLAVDDSLIDRKLIERLLKTSSYQVTAVESGVKALEYLGLLQDQNSDTHFTTKSHHHDLAVNLIITDYCMPGITGYDLLRKIKRSTLLKNIPVVIMSSENVQSRINSCLEEGAEEFFLKPVQQSDVNKLRPHLMKGSKLEKDIDDDQDTNIDDDQDTNIGEDQDTNIDDETNNSNDNNNKRKPDEECLSPERLRARYNVDDDTELLLL